jgi:hypothetical protein
VPVPVDASLLPFMVLVLTPAILPCCSPACQVLSVPG